MSVAVLLAATLVLVGGGCVSYSGCHTWEDRVRARYEQHFILPDDSSSTAFWKNTKHVFFDVVTCCFHEIWRGNARTGGGASSPRPAGTAEKGASGAGAA